MATKGHTETVVSNIKERRLQKFISVYIAYMYCKFYNLYATGSEVATSTGSKIKLNTCLSESVYI
jgi:hypothetical protein